MDTQVVRDLCTLIVEIRAIVEALEAISVFIMETCQDPEDREEPPDYQMSFDDLGDQS